MINRNLYSLAYERKMRSIQMAKEKKKKEFEQNYYVK